jgi:O-antigen ligase
VLTQTLHSRIHFFLSCLLAFLLPFKQLGGVQVISFGATLLLLNWLLEGDFRNKLAGIRFKYVFCVLIAFYLFHVVGLIWSQDVSAGVFDLQVKFSLFIFPWIYATRPFETKMLDRILSCFLLGSSALAIMLLLRAAYFYVVLHQNKFFYEELSSFLHPSYFSMYLNMGLLYMLFSVSRTNGTRKAGWLFLIPLFILMIVLLSSKLGLISLILILLGWMVYLVFGRKKYLIGLTCILTLTVLTGAVFKFFPDLTARMRNALHAVSSGNQDKTNGESTALRMLIWGVSKELIAAHPILGSGTGAGNDVLMEKYKQEGITAAYHKKLNAHNAYLQITVTLGLVGLLLLLGMLFLPLIPAIQEGKPMLLCFTLLIALNFVPESMLEAQAGVIFFAFFNSLFLFSQKSGYELSLPRTKWI